MKLAVIGTGNIGQALLKGMLNGSSHRAGSGDGILILIWRRPRKWPGKPAACGRILPLTRFVPRRPFWLR